MTQHLVVGPGVYLRVMPECMVGRPRPSTLPDHLKPTVSAFAAILPPDMPAGSVLMIGGKPCPVLWSEGARAVVEIAGKAWLVSHMTPSEMTLHRDSYDRGMGIQEWIVREPVTDPAGSSH